MKNFIEVTLMPLNTERLINVNAIDMVADHYLGLIGKTDGIKVKECYEVLKALIDCAIGDDQND